MEIDRLRWSIAGMRQFNKTKAMVAISATTTNYFHIYNNTHEDRAAGRKRTRDRFACVQSNRIAYAHTDETKMSKEKMCWSTNFRAIRSTIDARARNECTEHTCMLRIRFRDTVYVVRTHHIHISKDLAYALCTSIQTLLAKLRITQVHANSECMVSRQS